MEIISNLQNMPIELAEKVSEHIPALFDTCDRALSSTDSFYKEAIEKNDEFTQIQLDHLERDRKYYEQRVSEGKTDEEREMYRKKIEDIELRIVNVKDQALKYRDAQIKERGKFYVMIIGIMATTLGVTIRIGKRFK